MLLGIFYLYEFKILKIFKNYIFQSYDLIFFFNNVGDRFDQNDINNREGTG